MTWELNWGLVGFIAASNHQIRAAQEPLRGGQGSWFKIPGSGSMRQSGASPFHNVKPNPKYVEVSKS